MTAMRMIGWLASAAALTLAGPAHATCTLGKLFELPVTMDGLQPMVSASVNGRDVRFMADSGAFFSVISPGMAAEMELRRRPAPEGCISKASAAPRRCRWSPSRRWASTNMISRGMAREGEADIAAATKLDPDLADPIKRYDLPAE